MPRDSSKVPTWRISPARKNSPYEIACRNTLLFLIQPCLEIQRGPLGLPSKSLDITAIPSAAKDANRPDTSLSSVLGYAQSSSGKAMTDPRAHCKAKFLPRDKPVSERTCLIQSRSSKAWRSEERRVGKESRSGWTEVDEHR